MTSDPTNPERETKTPIKLDVRNAPEAPSIPPITQADFDRADEVISRVIPKIGEAKTPETDQFRKERLRITGTPEEDYLAEPEIAFARKLELSRDSARAEAEQLRERCARLENVVHALVEKRTDQHGFYYVSKHMGGLGDELSKTIDAALNQPKP